MEKSIQEDTELLNKIKNVEEETKSLLVKTSLSTNEKIIKLREKLKDDLFVLQRQIRALEEVIKEKAKKTDEYVHENPWKSIGIAAGVGVAIGFILGKVTEK